VPLFLQSAPAPARVDVGAPQAGRKVSDPGDAVEREADRIADQISAAPAAGAELGPSAAPATPCAACAAGAACGACGHGPAPLSRSADPAASPSGGAGARARPVDRVVGSGGSELEPAVRADFEPRLGRDLGAVRVHTGAEAAASARAYRARAYAVGNHIVFGQGQYSPGTTGGRRLLAHELAHVAAGVPPSTLARQELDAGVDAPDIDASVPGEGPTDASVPLPGGVPPAPPPAPLSLDGVYGPCGSASEGADRDAFAIRTDLHLDRNIPSTTHGMFDARYFPLAGVMPVHVKLSFNFVSADGAPGWREWLRRTVAGEDLSRFYWTSAEETDFKTRYIARVTSRWNTGFTMRSTKPCWGFRATPVISVTEQADPSTAHYAITSHKSPGPGIDYKSGTGMPDLAHPERPATADLWQSDLREEPNFRSVEVARNERTRLEGALAAAVASPVRFEQNRSDVRPAERAKLATFANALKQKAPSAPAIPVIVAGHASAEGESGHNLTLSLDRALAVEAVLTGLGIPQPVSSLGMGPTGALNDAANRRVDIEFDRTFEGSYASNRYSVAEHEFGHMLGLPDEYLNNAPGSGAHARHITLQTNYQTLLTSAGLSSPVWGTHTSSQMSAGVDVLPRHYLTIWEALGRMTAPHIAQGEWSMR
jgi:outer membrane protein OmpA-like peptidoglycan-associated protein